MFFVEGVCKVAAELQVFSTTNKMCGFNNLRCWHRRYGKRNKCTKCTNAHSVLTCHQIIFWMADVPNDVAAALEELEVAVDLGHVDRHRSIHQPPGQLLDIRCRQSRGVVTETGSSDGRVGCLIAAVDTSSYVPKRPVMAGCSHNTCYTIVPPNGICPLWKTSRRNEFPKRGEIWRNLSNLDKPVSPAFPFVVLVTAVSTLGRTLGP